jgi:hypothetical protein
MGHVLGQGHRVFDRAGRADGQYYLRIFQELAGSRGYSQSGTPLPLPLSEIRAYCDFFEITSLQEKTLLWKMIRRLDSAFVSTVSGQAQPPDKDTVPAVEEPSLSR